MADNKIISIPDGKICDYVDGKFRNDTPEEYVRRGTQVETSCLKGACSCARFFRVVIA